MRARSSFTPELILEQLMLPLPRCNAYFSKARHVFAVVRKCYSGADSVRTRTCDTCCYHFVATWAKAEGERLKGEELLFAKYNSLLIADAMSLQDSRYLEGEGDTDLSSCNRENGVSRNKFSSRFSIKRFKL